MDTVRNRTPAVGLPNGWMREESVRRNGLSRGKSDVYYISPAGKKIRSKPELIRYLGSNVDLTYFDYRSGTILPEKAKALKRPRSAMNGKLDLDTSVPNRQSGTVLKQPVTKRTNHKSNKVKSEPVRGSRRQPQQLFREKRLNGMQAVDIAKKVIETIDLPATMQVSICGSAHAHVGLGTLVFLLESRVQRNKPPQLKHNLNLLLAAVGPNATSDEILKRIASQLHDGSNPITGQASSALTKDPCVWLDTKQPICKSFIVTEDDIRRQESRVKAARERLEKALKQDTDIQRRELLLLA